MTGWKTWVATIGGVASGVVMICTGLGGDVIDPNQIWAGILVILTAFGVIGIGHKIEKLGNNIKGR